VLLDIRVYRNNIHVYIHVWALGDRSEEGHSGRRARNQGVLQCVAVCCSVLQCVAVCCSVLQCVAVCCSVLQYVAVGCSGLQCVAMCCRVLQCVAVCCSVLVSQKEMLDIRVCCNVLQCLVCFSVLQYRMIR